MVYQKLVEAKRWQRLTGESPPVLSQDEQAFMDSLVFAKKETDVILHLTPKLEQMVQTAATARGVPAVLVNSERHAWVKCCHSGADTVPDGLVAHPSIIDLEVGKADLQLCVKPPSECGELQWVCCAC